MKEEIIRGPRPSSSKVIEVEPLENYMLRVKLSDGRRGIFDVSPYLDMEVFRELKDPDYFRRVYIDSGIIVWPHEQDIAPETIEEELKPEPRQKTPFWMADHRG